MRLGDQLTENMHKALLFAATPEYRYLMYSDGSVCPIPVSQFDVQFIHAAFLIIDGEPLLPSLGRVGFL